MWEVIKRIACFFYSAEIKAYQAEISFLRDEVAELKKTISNLKWQLKQLKPPPFKPEIRGEVSYSSLHAILHKRFPEAQIFLSDRVKYLCDIEDINAFLEQDETNRREYVKELYDCDDFTYRLMGQFSIPGWAELTKGILWTDVHALLCCVDANRDVWNIEPQTDSVKSSLDSWQGKVSRVIMM